MSPVWAAALPSDGKMAVHLRKKTFAGGLKDITVVTSTSCLVLYSHLTLVLTLVPYNQTHTKVFSLRKIELAVPYPSVVKTFYQLLWLLSTGYCKLNHYTNLKLNKPLLSSLKKLLMKEINEHCNLQMIVLKLYYWCNKLGKTCPVESSETNYKTYHLKIQSMFQSHIITADKSCVIHLYVLQLCMR